MRPLFAKLGMETSSKIVKVPEEMVKGLLFNCQDCAQCVLHYNGMTCPMNCPKNLRNGPCGGVRLNGNCEVKPEMDCVWVKGIERAPKTPYDHEILRLNPPVDWRLKGQASWVTYSLGARPDSDRHRRDDPLRRRSVAEGRRQPHERADYLLLRRLLRPSTPA